MGTHVRIKDFKIKKIKIKNKRCLLLRRKATTNIDSRLKSRDITLPTRSSSQSYHLVAQMVKCLSTVRETRVRSLGQEGPLEKEMAIHSSTIAWKVPWTEEAGRL